MNKTRKISTAGLVVLAALALGVTLAVTVVLSIRNSTPAATLAAVPLTGNYAGQIKLQRVVFSATLASLDTPIQPSSVVSDLGTIDFGLLMQSSLAISGYVDMANSLVFSPLHSISVTVEPLAIGTAPTLTFGTPVSANLAVGPLVTGTFDGINVRLQSELINLTTGAGQHLKRQFLLQGQIVLSDTNVLSGTYYETLWGYGPKPLTMVGSFKLIKPVYVPASAALFRVFVPTLLR